MNKASPIGEGDPRIASVLDMFPSSNLKCRAKKNVLRMSIFYSCKKKIQHGLLPGFIISSPCLLFLKSRKLEWQNVSFETKRETLTSSNHSKYILSTTAIPVGQDYTGGVIVWEPGTMFIAEQQYTSRWNAVGIYQRFLHLELEPWSLALNPPAGG